MTCADVLAAAGHVRVLVVGDICLDRWCRYDPSLSEQSRETGIPRCAVVSTSLSPGAGGTVARNLAALGVKRVSVLGVSGRDGFGHELRQALSVGGVENDLLIADESVATFTYTKLINVTTGVEDLPRIDFVNTGPLNSTIEEQVLERFRSSIAAFDAVVVSDQAETDQGGIVTPNLRSALAEAARADRGRPFVADSRKRVEHFRHMIATPNESEANEACHRAFGSVDYRQLHRTIDGPALVVTMGRAGAWLVDGNAPRLFGSCPGAEPVDTCGAGDSLSAGLALALAVGADVEFALRFGIIVAGVTIGKPGTGSATPSEVLAMAESIEAEG